MPASNAVIQPLTCDGVTAAKLIGCSFPTLKKYVRRGEIVPVRVKGFDPRYSVEQLKTWVRKRSGVLAADEE